MALLPENFSLDQLREYIRKKLGGSVWRLEGMGTDQNDLIDQSVSEALHAYSRRCPMVGWETIKTSSTNTVYTLKTKTLYGIWRVEFIYPSLVVSPFMSSLVGVSPVINLEGQDFAIFLNWRKTFQRVTGLDPKWTWDEDNQLLRIHNPSNNAIAGVFLFKPREFDKVKLVHKDWIRRASLAHAKNQLGEIRSKFGNTIPGPTGGGLELNGDKLKQEAKDELDKLMEELFGFQTKLPPMFD